MATATLMKETISLWLAYGFKGLVHYGMAARRKMWYRRVLHPHQLAAGRESEPLNLAGAPETSHPQRHPSSNNATPWEPLGTVSIQITIPFYFRILLLRQGLTVYSR